MSEDRIPYQPQRYPPAEMLARAELFFELVNRRRSVRDFSDEPVDRQLIEFAIQAASTSPSGAHRQPWKFVAVQDPAIKHEIRIAAEKEEREVCERFLAEQITAWKESSPAEATQLAMADLCHMLLCTNEFLYVE